MFENSLKFITGPRRGVGGGGGGKSLGPRNEEGTESQVSKFAHWHWLPLVWGYGFLPLGP